MAKRKALTSRQKQALCNLRNGRVSSYGLRGQSEFGGHERTLWSLRQLGFITSDGENAITPLGREAVKDCGGTR